MGHSVDIFFFQESLATLYDMFPGKSLKYLKIRLANHSGPLDVLIDKLLTDTNGDSDEDGDSGVVVTENNLGHHSGVGNDEESIFLVDANEDAVNSGGGVDRSEESIFLNANASLDSSFQGADDSVIVCQDEAVAGPSTSIGPTGQVPNTYIERNYSTLSQFFPEVSIAFLQQKAWEIGDDPKKLEQFIIVSFENKSSLPSKKEYEKEKGKEDLYSKIRQMTAKDFLNEYENPHTHYQDLSRIPSESYKQHVLYYLTKHYPTLTQPKIKKAMELGKSLFYPSVKELEVIVANSKGKSKRKTPSKKIPKPPVMDQEFLKEYIYYKLEPKIRGLQERNTRLREEALSKARDEGTLFECGVCFDDECLLAEVVMCEKGCMFCSSCAKKGSEVQAGENKTTISCFLSCGSEIPLKSLQGLLPPKLYSKLFEKKQLQEIQAAGLEDLVQCPACNYAVIIPDSQDKVFTCGNPDCGKQTCRLCGEESHIPLSCDEIEKDDEVKARTKVENAMTEAMLRECPSCKKKFFKEEGCNKMTCTCGQTMCYLCRKPVSNDYKHFYGQGGTPKKDKCPLWSNVSKLHTDEVTDAANKAKNDVGAQKLKNDPSKNIQKPKSYHLGPEVFENAVFEESDSDDDDSSDDDPFNEDEDDYDSDDIHFIDDDEDMEVHFGEYRLHDWD